MVVNIQGNAVVPSLKISSHELYFGTCKLNEKRDIIIEITNTHASNTVELNFEKLAFIYVKPERAVL